MHAEEATVDDGRNGERAERLDARFVHLFAVLVEALLLKGEVLSEVTAFVVSTEQHYPRRIPDLESKEVEQALFRCQRQHLCDFICRTSIPKSPRST